MLAAKAMGYDSCPMIGFGRPNDRGGFCPRKTLEKLRRKDPGISALPVRIVRLFPPACAHENSGVFVTRSGGGRTREPGHAERRGFPTDRRRD